MIVTSNLVQPRTYVFELHRWHFRGVVEDLKLKPIVLEPEIGDHIERLLENATDNTNNASSWPDDSIWDKLSNQHYNLWKNSKERHKHDTKERVEYRRESLSSSHNKRIASLNKNILFNTDSSPNVKKMFQAQVDRAQAEYARRIKELDEAINKADILCRKVAYGVIQVLGE